MIKTRKEYIQRHRIIQRLRALAKLGEGDGIVKMAKKILSEAELS